MQGPYPVGNPSAQPVMKFAFPAPEAGARDQTFRLILQPELWSQKARVRFTNALGTKPVTFDGVYAGLQLSERDADAPAPTAQSRLAASRASRSRPASPCGAIRSRCRS